MSVIQKQIKFELDGAVYDISFPNVGQYMDIENMRIALTNGAYTDLLRTGLKSSHFQVDLVDAISVFYVLVPNLRQDLSVSNYNELDVFMAKKIVKAYKGQVQKWYDDLMNQLLDDEDIPDPIEPKEDEEKEGGKAIDLG